MKKTALFLAAVAAAALAGAAETAKFAPSKPQDFLHGEKLEEKDGALVMRGGMFTTKEHVAFDSAKPGVLSLEYKLLPDAKPTMFVVAFDARDAKGALLIGANIFGHKGTETELAAPVKKGDRVLKLKDGSRWQTPEFRRGTMVAFGAKADSSDLPNRRISSLIVSVSSEGEVRLRYPVGVDYPAGTSVRAHRDTGSFGIGSTYLKPTAEWKKCTVKIRPRREGDAGSWWPFVEKVGVRFGFLGNNPEAGVMIRNIEFTQE